MARSSSEGDPATPGEAGRDPPVDETTRQDEGSPAGRARALRQVTGLVLGQLGAVTALAFYFGWARTNAYLRYFGLDTSVVNFTTTDYVLRSVGAAYWPLMGLGVLVVVALTVHPRIRAVLAAASPAGRRRALAVATLVGVVMLAVAVVGLYQVWIFPASVPVIPLLIATGVGVLTYTAVLGSDVSGRDSLLGKAQFVALAGLIAGGVFWAWGSYADRAGLSAARTTAANLPFQADVAVYSAQRLVLSGPGIQVAPLDAEESAYLFRYTGLRLLLRSDNRYFLLPRDWQRGRDPVFVLSESDGMRLQFLAPPFP